MNPPSLNHFSILVQYVRNAVFNAHARPYESGPVTQQVALFLSSEPLPQPHHYRVELTTQLLAKDGSGDLRFTAEGVIEAIVVVAEGVSAERLEETLKVEVGSALVGSVRTLLTTLSLGTGYGPLVLPPVPSAQLMQLAPPPQPVLEP